jgi:hypothetical protein
MAKNVKLSSRSNDVKLDWQAMQSIATGTCYAVIVDDFDIALIISLLRYAEWPSRWDNAPADFSEVTQEVTGLEWCLMSGCNLDTLGTAITQAAQTIAQAMTASGGSGGGACYPSSPALDCLSQYTTDQLLDTPADEVDPFGETPPDGFATMAEYLQYKCRIAHAIVDDVVHFFQGLQGISGFQATVAAIIPVLGAALVGTGAIVVPPAAVAEIAVAILLTIAIAATAFQVSGTIASYVEDHRSSIVCALYQSSAPAQALQALTGAIEDALQAVEWSTIFGGAGAAVADAFGLLASKFENNGLVNNLFTLLVTFVYPEKDCSECQEAIAWHFDEDAEGWVHTIQTGEEWEVSAGWDDGTPAPDPLDTSDGYLKTAINKTSVSPSYEGWWHRSVSGMGIVAHEGDEFRMDTWYTSSDHSGFYVKIVYSDDATDQAYFPNPTGATWAQFSVAVSAGNDGKTVKELWVNGHTGETTGQWVYGFERAIWDAV